VPILRELPFSLTADVLAHSLGERGDEPVFREAVTRVVKMIEELAKPAAVYDFVPVREVGEDYAIVGQDIRLSLGPHADLLAPAKQALIFLVTLGPAVEERVEQLLKAGDTLEGYLLDSAAVMALGLAGDNLKRMAEARAAELGWGVGRRLAPGSLVGWPLRDQDKLVSLLPIQEIGVHITQSHVLVPHKSATTLIGLGPGYEEHTVGTVCYLCNLRATCWRRRL
jgi:cobalamin-dependent methionine synthase I